ncbi:MAG: hypothetical protein JGK24_22750 [Microcoleus sp. PH2017_29_MFU_D_A]|uniref:hypothetical protein n=1 Tax=unclassified Microcoleus TaxID=2642155 RepID=UPI001E114645|nr:MULTISPECIES: hypothetical protein [unclassified Microcoleus]MCC3419262.1 hypothetical protein [Microcoleus sp. PH2017_07_MST_O_A]MCC3429106.1 hypothetical protein [Microcoleus sp. PH2017_04_SCI_O_A]MCC3441384.1 hypothetical protein [Microcoleus sp. PH2017_03_ELD_O_A]MCC3467376.1 hypothetical protein [Microcoleus sp. PH2017_06_SFM_O_A]MCC3504544.1 hypothetical protein [Microcoleus sp. PH2017_19_SFW_U_A]MCC3510496.1 hypothetical protein [Microcoleus sp. PH2017_17_BER_D_A]TAE08256.1 MAG: hy
MPLPTWRAIALSPKIPLSLAASRLNFRSTTQPDTLAIAIVTVPQQSQPAIFVKLVEAKENSNYSLIP